MAVTVSEILNMHNLKDILIKSGEAGKFKKVEWVLVMDTVEVIHFLKGGEIILTSGKLWPHNKQEESKLLHSLKNMQISGIIFATGYYLKECPEEAISFGAKYDIPILEMPFEKPFIEVTKTIIHAILEDQNQKSKLIEILPKDVTNPFNNIKTYQDICNIASDVFDCSILLTNERETIKKKIINDDIISLKNLLQEFHIQHEEKNNRKVNMIKVDNFGVNIAVPLVDNNKIWGILWLINKDFVEGKVIEYIALLLNEVHASLKEREVQKKHLRIEVLEYITTKKTLTQNFLSYKLKELEISNTNKNFIIGFIRITNCSSTDVYEIKNYINLRLENDLSGFCELYQGKVVVFLSSTVNKDDFLCKIKKVKKTIELSNKMISLSLLFGGIKKEVNLLRESYEEAEILNNIKGALHSEDSLLFAADFKKEILLYKSLNLLKIEELKKEILPSFFFTKEGYIFYETLKTLWLNDFDRNSSAKSLYIHHNTLRYRINKIEDVLNDSLSSPRCQYWIQCFFYLENISKPSHDL